LFSAIFGELKIYNIYAEEMPDRPTTDVRDMTDSKHSLENANSNQKYIHVKSYRSLISLCFTLFLNRPSPFRHPSCLLSHLQSYFIFKIKG